MRRSGMLGLVKIVPILGKPPRLIPRNQAAGFRGLKKADARRSIWAFFAF